MEKTRIREGDFFELIKSISFSVFGVFVFFMPMLIKEEIVSPVLFISDLIYIKYQEFIYFCVIVFIVLLSIKQICKKEKSILDIIDTCLKFVSVVVLIVLIIKNKFIFFKDENLLQIMKNSIFKLTIFFPVSSIFLPFLLEYGLLNILDGCFGGVTKKFFKSSAKNIIIFAIFFFVDSFLGFYVVYKLYKEGKLRKNECINSVLNYPILQISLITYIANQLKINFISLLSCCLFIFIVTNLIVYRIYPIKNKERTFFVKNKFKEKSYKKNKLKMSLVIYLENREKKSLFKHILNYLNETINIVANMIPMLLFSFLCFDFILRNDGLINIFAVLYEYFLALLKLPHFDYIAKSIVLGFFNQVYSIEVLNNGIDFVSRLIIAIIIICQGISLTSNIIFIRRYMRFIICRDIFLVYLEKIVIMTLTVFLIYYFYLGFSM